MNADLYIYIDVYIICIYFFIAKYKYMWKDCMQTCMHSCRLYIIYTIEGCLGMCRSYKYSIYIFYDSMNNQMDFSVLR